jgi:hypothetical protein
VKQAKAGSGKRTPARSGGRQPAEVGERDEDSRDGVERGQLARSERADAEDRAPHAGSRGRIAAALEEGREQPASEGTPGRVHTTILAAPAPALSRTCEFPSRSLRGRTPARWADCLRVGGHGILGVGGW